MTITINAEKREKGKPESLRAKGLFPAVYYGKKENTTPIQITYKDFLKVWKDAGESSVISIKTPEKAVDALIHDVQFDPISGKPVHADFYVFEKGHKVEIAVPIEFIGESPAVKAGGVLIKALHELKIKADPSNLPHNIEVDISGLLEIGNDIFAKDIKLGVGVELMENPDEVVAVVNAPKEEKEEVPVDLTAIEVEKRGKDAVEGEEGAEGSAEKSESDSK